MILLHKDGEDSLDYLETGVPCVSRKMLPWREWMLHTSMLGAYC